MKITNLSKYSSNEEREVLHNIELSEEEINEVKNKLSDKQIQEYMNDYKLNYEEAKNGLAGYLAWNYKLNSIMELQIDK